MQEQEVEFANPYCYDCHEEVVSDLHVLANKSYIFMFHKKCMEKYLEEFKKKIPVIQQAT